VPKETVERGLKDAQLGPFSSVLARSLGCADQLRPKRPRETRVRLARGDAARPQAAAHEQGRCFGSCGDRETHRADALCSPAVGQADDEQTGVARAFEDAFLAGGNENRLGHGSDHLLHEQGRAGEKPARVAASRSGVGFRSEEPERGSERLREPGGQLDRRPVVFDSSERGHDRPGRDLTTPDEHRNVARGMFEDNLEVLGERTLDQAQRCIGQDEIDIVLFGEPDGVGSRFECGKGRDTRRHASLGEPVSMFGECSVHVRQLAVVSQQASENELARGPSRERLGDCEQSAKPLGFARYDHDQALPRRPRGTVVRGEDRILAKDRLLELVEGRARLDAQLVDEQTARLPIDLERIGLSTGAVERSHERRAEPLAKRVRLHEHFELGDELRVSL
jgi:hypothetical protein